jgi:hypothetical protein
LNCKQHSKKWIESKEVTQATIPSRELFTLLREISLSPLSKDMAAFMHKIGI